MRIDGSPLERFHSKYVVTADGCWQWVASKNRDGYGKLALEGGWVLAYKWFFEGINGAVPTGFELDHTCRNRACVNPAHLEQVSHEENMRRGKWAQRTHCKNGHALTGDNVHMRPNRRGRICRSCNIEGSKRFRERSHA